MNNETLRAVVVQPGEPAVVKEIDGSLPGLQNLVGGYIQISYPFDDAVGLICNDKGKLLGMPLNRSLKNDAGEVYDILAGNFIIVGLSKDNFASLTPEQEAKYLELYKVPERFEFIDGKIVASPISDKISFHAFRESVITDLQNRFEKDGLKVDIIPKRVEKPSKTYEGIMVSIPGSSVSMCIDLEPTYAQLKHNDDISHVIAPLYEGIRENLSQMSQYDISDKIKDYAWIRDHLVIDVVSKERAGDYLQGVPHTDIGADLTAIYRIVLDDSSSTVITNAMREQLGISEEQLHADALVTSEKRYPIKMETLGSFISAMVGDSGPNTPSMWVCMADHRLQGGAGVIAYSNFPEEVSSRITEGNFYILPSSLHEVIIIPDTSDISVTELENIVQAVNASELKPEDILSNRAYYFDVDKKEITFAKEREEQVKSLEADKTHIPDVPKRKGR